MSEKRYVGKIKEGCSNGEFGVYDSSKIVVNNPHPKYASGHRNEYNKGLLIWYDAEQDKYYHVKNMNIVDIPEQYQKNEFTKNVTIDLDNEYLVSECK